MDAKDLFSSTIDDAEHQLRQVLAGLDEAAFDRKLAPSAMSPRETVAHLAECYVAAQKHARGESHEWGTHRTSGQSAPALVEEMFLERGKAKEAALASSDPESLKEMLAYTSSHDYYHVGQMCMQRLAFEPDWNAYSIYKS